ncbi:MULTISPECIES: ergothioneine biosynthesis protein EgtB [Rhodopseudomonas]|uniref:Sulfatase maturase n=1 Tax=Rhodopseudomonas palustris TaxID=1076 RepID=A0A0D7ESA5_RHOPL|nr:MULTISPECIES: ergothioneine biosynthesis protein EgtB [Rhodopseudomonas]KIZ43445.1 sulfatase maturase [Rhodopseudomonas palustris]MDF3810190.1 ergothioneine biosynthesis protein EgtB [Rhodopseudomonas sp. BAL398]WOK20175.1 ergothioneine biosynthesis protein EgtB [Rhodopseudomonas sp. BAL398]
MTTIVSAGAPLAAPHASAISASSDLAQDLARAYRAVRDETERRAAPLSPEDQVVQSMPDASPAKWHRAHTTWFFEQFLLGQYCPDYAVYHPDYAYLFNSYYVTAGPRHSRAARGLLTRPGAAEVTAYRRHVDAAILRFFGEAEPAELAAVAPLLEVGLNHEQQHQELMITDILHAFAQNPIPPAYDPAWQFPRATRQGDDWVTLAEGIHSIGHVGDGFHFDNEEPAHRALVGPVKLARNLVSNAEWLDFIADGGYRTATLWLMDGFATVEREGWEAPGHWREVDGEWQIMTLGGLQKVDPDAPVCHVSYYEADAFARWRGQHLPTEMEWEVAARAGQLNDAFGMVWQWTRSAYAAYPGYRAIEGALGEYNGKFMINQLVLRGSSLATPKDHSRLTYRNFFYPHHRWQFTGLRLADYAV